MSCNCDIDGSWYTPHWFFLGSGSPDLFVAPHATTVPSEFADWFALNLDPSGEIPRASDRTDRRSDRHLRSSCRIELYANRDGR